MNNEQKIEKTILGLKKGTFQKIKIKGTIKEIDNSLKITDLVGRFGIEYNNTQQVKNQPKNEEKTARNYTSTILVPNTIFISKDGRKKARIYVSNNIYHRAKSKYYVNGVEYTKQEMLDMGMKVRKSHECICFEVFLENIISIG